MERAQIDAVLADAIAELAGGDAQNAGSLLLDASGFLQGLQNEAALQLLDFAAEVLDLHGACVTVVRGIFASRSSQRAAPSAISG